TLGDRRDDAADVDLIAGGGPSLPDSVAAERRRQVVRELLDELPPEQAETFALRVALGFSLPEVAAATGAPLNTVRSRIRLAKASLKRRIEKDPQLCELLEVAA